MVLKPVLRAPGGPHFCQSKNKSVGGSLKFTLKEPEVLAPKGRPLLFQIQKPFLEQYINAFLTPPPSRAMSEGMGWTAACLEQTPVRFLFFYQVINTDSSENVLELSLAVGYACGWRRIGEKKVKRVQILHKKKEKKKEYTLVNLLFEWHRFLSPAHTWLRLAALRLERWDTRWIPFRVRLAASRTQ